MALKQHKANLTEKYEQLSVNYKQLHQMVLNITSQSGDTCAPLFLDVQQSTSSSSSNSAIVLFFF